MQPLLALNDPALCQEDSLQMHTRPDLIGSHLTMLLLFSLHTSAEMQAQHFHLLLLNCRMSLSMSYLALQPTALILQ